MNPCSVGLIAVISTDDVPLNFYRWYPLHEWIIPKKKGSFSLFPFFPFFSYPPFLCYNVLILSVRKRLSSFKCLFGFLIGFMYTRVNHRDCHNRDPLNRNMDLLVVLAQICVQSDIVPRHEIHECVGSFFVCNDERQGERE